MGGERPLPEAGLAPDPFAVIGDEALDRRARDTQRRHDLDAGRPDAHAQAARPGAAPQPTLDRAGRKPDKEALGRWSGSRQGFF